jgi:phage-related protein
MNDPWSVHYYRDERGRDPVGDFISSCEEQLRVKIARALLVLKQSGNQLGMPLAAPVAGHRFWELRVQAGGNIARIFYFAATGRSMVLLHGYIKETVKAPRADLAVATRRMEQYLSRR